MKRYKVTIKDKFITADYEILALNPRDAVILVMSRFFSIQYGFPSQKQTKVYWTAKDRIRQIPEPKSRGEVKAKYGKPVDPFEALNNPKPIDNNEAINLSETECIIGEVVGMGDNQKSYFLIDGSEEDMDSLLYDLIGAAKRGY